MYSDARRAPFLLSSCCTRWMFPMDTDRFEPTSNSDESPEQIETPSPAKQLLRPLLQLAVIVWLSSILAAFLTHATDPESGTLPIVIESPPLPSEPVGFASEPRASKIYLRPPEPAGKTKLVRNRGRFFRFPAETGTASWYGYDHIGRQTAGGEWFDPEAMIAAHKDLPLGSVVRVHRLDTKQTAIVTIRDRGPYVEGRIIDLAREPAARLNLLGEGIAPCRIEVLRYPLPKTEIESSS